MDIGYTDAGLVVGLSSGGGGTEFGARFTRGLKRLPQLGNGLLSLGAGVSRSSYSTSTVVFDQVASTSASSTVLFAAGNYHFPLKNDRIDAFAGAGLYYSIVSSSSSAGGSAGASAMGLTLRLGGRYFVSDKLAVYGDTGMGGSALNVGVTMRLR